jgi:hypothetical protein
LVPVLTLELVGDAGMRVLLVDGGEVRFSAAASLEFSKTLFHQL